MPAKRCGAHVGDRAHQHAAGAAAVGDDAIRGAVAVGDEVTHGGDEVAKGVGLGGELAGLVPTPALFRAAAHMGDGVDEAAVDQRQAVGREASVYRVTIGAVAVDQQRRRPVALEVAPMHQRDRHALAVVGVGEDAARHISRGVEILRRLLLLAQDALAIDEIVVVDLLAAGHRGEAEAEGRRIEFVDRLERQRVGLRLEGDLMRARRRRARARPDGARCPGAPAGRGNP